MAPNNRDNMVCYEELETERFQDCGDSIRVMHPLFHGDDDGSIPLSPLQFEIGEIAVPLAMRLNELWHSVLPITDQGNLQRNKHCICFAAFYKNVYYATAIWTTPIAANQLDDGFNMLELRRFAISDDSPKNTASRLLKLMRLEIKNKFPEIKKLISYQAIDHHNGTIYKASGWTIGGRSKSREWHKGKKRAERQKKSDKIRWEYSLVTVQPQNTGVPGAIQG